VQAHAAHALAALGDPRGPAAILPMLASRRVRGDAREALLAFGEGALPLLEEALADEALPHEVRRHVPRTISRFPGPLAAPILLRRFVTEPDGMVRFKMLRGLNRLAAEHPDLELDAGILREATRRTLETLYRLLEWRLTVVEGAARQPERRTPGHELLVQLLRDKEVHAVERLFRLLGLQHRGEDFENIYRGLRSGNAKVRAGSRELLENLLLPPVREAVLALVDDIPDERRLLGAGTFYAPSGPTYEALLATLLEEPGETLRCIAAYHVGELGLVGLRERLEAYRSEPTGLFLLRVIERALALLSAAPRLVHAG
jgi:HEAT repeat protein